MGKKPRTDTRARPKKCLSGPADEQGPWGMVTNMVGMQCLNAYQLKFSSEFDQFRSF